MTTRGAGTLAGDAAETDRVVALMRFHPLIREWFSERLGDPTPIQAAAWPAIDAGQNVLVSAPTGCGKTLTAFLVALDRFAQGRLTPGATRVLYVSPLKALNNDIRRNLERPLAELRERFDQTAGSAGPLGRVRTATRSGDTDRSERARLMRHPPEILITTPESLNLMLTTVRGRLALAEVDTVILDEIHAIAGNRRGVHLMTAIERIVELSGEVQRIALSATVKPLDAVAAFVGGYRQSDHGLALEPRDVVVVETPNAKRIELRVEAPAGEDPPQSVVERDRGHHFWQGLGAHLAERVAGKRSTLIFTNNRALAERLAHHMNATGRDEALLAYAHHGSLARELRHDVERRLAAGELRAIVATSSLELGIDIGSLDEVVMVQCPPSAASALQRIGRAGHGVGQTSRAAIIGTYPHDFLEAAGIARAALERDIEATHLLDAPLDVLAQIIVGMTGSEAWNADHLLAVLRRSHPYRNLDRETLQLVLEMLAGRYASTRIRALAPRISIDPDANDLIESRKGALLALYSSGGTIPDRGYYKLRHAEHGTVMGELDEEFVWEARVGQVFTLGTRAWQIEAINHDDVLARPAAGGQGPPFWRADALSRGAHTSRRIADLLERAEAYLAADDADALRALLRDEFAFEPAAAEALLEYLRAQREHTGTALPHRHHLLVEFIASGPGGYATPDGAGQIVLHTFWGGRVNRPLAIALERALERQQGDRVEVQASNDFVAIQMRHPPDAETLLTLVHAGNVDELVREGLAESEFLGGRFREAAGRALLLPRPRFGKRLPLWMARQKAKELLDTVRRYPDFPIVLEAWRTCLADEFEMDALGENLDALAAGTIRIGEAQTASPSPFAANVTWSQITERYMYADDRPPSGEGSPDAGLLGRLLREGEMGGIALSIAADYQRRRQRLLEGYPPRDAVEIVEYVRDRVVVREVEWEELRQIAGAEAEFDDAAARLVRLSLGTRAWITARADALHVQATWCPEARLAGLGGHALPPLRRSGDERDGAALGAEWLSFYAPLTRDALATLLPVHEAQLDAMVAAWRESEATVTGPLLEGAPGDTEQICDSEVWEQLLRRQRRARRNAVRATTPIRRAAELPLFFAHLASLGTECNLEDALERLRGHATAVAALEQDLLPARLPTYDPRELDAVLASGTLLWRGAGPRRIVLIPPEELDLLPPAEAALADAFVDPAARYDFATLAENAAIEDIAEFSDALWRAIWSGAVTSDDFQLLRAGLSQQFTLPAARGADTHGVRAPSHRARARNRARRRARGWPGILRRTPQVAPDDTPLGRADAARDRARILLDRYGVLCREVLAREAAPFRWRDVFGALRAMELAGEVEGGVFFEGLSGPQFASARAMALLGTSLDPARRYWLAAHDPYAPNGAIAGRPVPPRRPGNYLVFRGSTIIATVEGQGRRLEFALAPDDPQADDMLVVLDMLLHRAADPLHRIRIETINGEPALGNAYLAVLRRRFDVHADHRHVELLKPRQ